MHPMTPPNPLIQKLMSMAGPGPQAPPPNLPPTPGMLQAPQVGGMIGMNPGPSGAGPMLGLTPAGAPGAGVPPPDPATLPYFNPGTQQFDLAAAIVRHDAQQRDQQLQDEMLKAQQQHQHDQSMQDDQQQHDNSQQVREHAMQIHSANREPLPIQPQPGDIASRF